MADQLIRLQGFEKDRQARIKRNQAINADLLTDDIIHGIANRTVNGKRFDPRTLAQFRLEIARAKKTKNFSEGITARTVIDIAHRDPKMYVDPKKHKGNRHDLDKARKEIFRAVPASMQKGVCRFIVNASRMHGERQHYVTVRFMGWDDAALAVHNTFAPNTIAKELRRGKLKFSCTCDRWKYTFSYLASIGGYIEGHEQLGFPKVRNNRLEGIACKHVLRTMVEIDRSSFFGTFLSNHLKNAVKKIKTTKMSRAEADKAKTSKVMTSEDREKRNKADRMRRELKKARMRDVKLASQGKIPPQKTASPFAARLKNLAVKAAAKLIAKTFGVSEEDMIKAIEEWKQRNVKHRT